MKRNLLLMVCLLVSYTGFAQFTPGNLAIYRYGNGDALTNGGHVPVFIDEYTPAGVKVASSTIAISQTANGANYGLDGLGLTSAGTYNAEGYPVLSRDGTTLSIIGYNPAQSGEYVIGTIDASGTVNTTTLVDVSDAIGSPRSAVVEGTAVYFNGYQNGVRYKTLGTTTASTRVSNLQDAPRVLTIAETILNGVSGTKIFAPENSTVIPFSNLVTTSSSFTSLGFSGAAPVGAHQVAAVKSLGGRTIIYVIDDNGSSPLIRKYRSNLGGTDWLAQGSVSVPEGTKSLTATIDANGVTLYFTTLGTPGSANSQLYKLTDSFTAANEGSVNLSGTPTLLATADANTTFRGVTFTPGTGVLPVTLTAFNAKAQSNSVKLSWTTASEKNSSQFEVLRSADGKEFIKIGQVVAAGNSDVPLQYAFNDANPFPGVNYYKLQQVDNDGKSVFYGPVDATVAIQKTDFSIYASASRATADVYIYSTKKQPGKLRLLTINGQLLSEQNLQLEQGYNKVNVPAGKSNSGVQVAVLKAQDTVTAKKFVWQQ
ncbi:hypothetical protein FW774_13440 [Pedobacter sp. BS3]|uniref:hypothetical protein n=1 Tax=Pedobacter sp. BS3 TaxID=2567937 RepID=UPI0011F00976|nr:hypothetical protein [Pedobacter sp. BS3]TZF83284.1 hypothetical protein FW774_13440 [Pedobacter sp. BS3]